MKTFRIVLCVALVLAASSVPAQSMMEMKRTAQADYQKADAELNLVYKKVLAALSPKGAAALREAQSAWMIFRDKNAEAYGTCEEGGSLESYMEIRSLEATTTHRTASLKKMFLSDHYPY